MKTGDRIRSLREAAKLTQEEVAARAGLSARTLSYIENGRDAKESTLRAIARAIGCSVSDLVEDAA